MGRSIYMYLGPAYAPVKGNPDPPHLGKIWGIGKWGRSKSSNSPAPGALEGVKCIYFVKLFPHIFPYIQYKKSRQKGFITCARQTMANSLIPGEALQIQCLTIPPHMPHMSRGEGGSGLPLIEALPHGFIKKSGPITSAYFKVLQKFTACICKTGHARVVFCVSFYPKKNADSFIYYPQIESSEKFNFRT